jgi:pectate lyase
MTNRTLHSSFILSSCALSLALGCSEGPSGSTDMNAGSGGASTGSGGAASGSGGQQTSSGGQTGGSGAAASGGQAQTGGSANSGGANSGGTGGSGVGGSPPGSGGSDGDGGTDGSGGDSAGLCAPMGWATRDGREGGHVEVTGGGETTPVVVDSFEALQTLAEGDTPAVIHVDGPVGSGWSGTDGDRLEVGSNKTIVGLRPGTLLDAPIHVDGSSNVIIRNLVIQGPGSNDDQAWDNINIEGGSKNVWIDHCEFWDGQDGNADVVKGADNVTFTWNIFGYRTDGEHNFSNLVASSDDEPESVGKLDITLMFNWFTGIAQRQPRCRYGDIHVVNNLFTRDGQPSDYGISAGKDCRVRTENNHFIDIQTPIYTSHQSGSSANELVGDNIFENTSGNTMGYGTAFDPPYEYEDKLVPAAQVEALVMESVGATLENPDACD